MTIYRSICVPWEIAGCASQRCWDWVWRDGDRGLPSWHKHLTVVVDVKPIVEPEVYASLITGQCLKKKNFAKLGEGVIGPAALGGCTGQGGFWPP